MPGQNSDLPKELSRGAEGQRGEFLGRVFTSWLESVVGIG